MTEDICICCKDIFESSQDIVKLTCGHIGHYECLYMSFKFNIKRYKPGNECEGILECPYCRKNVKPLPEKIGFNYCNFIHGGLSITNINSTKLFQWTSNHEGSGYCKYDKNGNYCNLKFGDWGNGPNKDMCYTHRNYIHYGNNYCKACKSGKYCNNLLKPINSSQNYCWKHINLENQLECSFVKSSGMKCSILTLNTNSICDKHNLVSIKEKPFKCKEVFKSGKHKGEICNVFNCKRHNKIIDYNFVEKEDAFELLDSKETLDKNIICNDIEQTSEIQNIVIENDLNTKGTIINAEQNYDINSFDEYTHTISYLSADIGSLLDDFAGSSDILVLNSLQVIKSLLISLKNNNK